MSTLAVPVAYSPLSFELAERIRRRLLSLGVAISPGGVLEAIPELTTVDLLIKKLEHAHNAAIRLLSDRSCDGAEDLAEMHNTYREAHVLVTGSEPKAADNRPRKKKKKVAKEQQDVNL